MIRELSLTNVTAEVAAWRKTKRHRTSALPKEIANHIRELAKSHKTHHIAEKLKMSATTVNKVLRIDQGFRALPRLVQRYKLYPIMLNLRDIINP